MTTPTIHIPMPVSPTDINDLTSLAPTADNSEDFGSALKRWKTLYAAAVQAGDITTPTDNTGDIGTATERWKTIYAATVQANGVMPPTDNTSDIGSGTFRFRDCYVANGVTTTSDVRRKQDIVPCSLGLEFVNSVGAIDFRVLDGKRVHMGFPAQGLEEAFKAVGLDRAAVVVDKEGWYGIRYEELIAPLWTAVQELDVKANYALNTQACSYDEIVKESLERKQAIEELRVSISEVEHMKRELQIVETIKEVVVEVPVIREVIKEVVVEKPIEVIKEVVVTKHHHINKLEVAILVALVLNFIASIIH